MPFGGFSGTLHFFGIHNTNSKSEGKNQESGSNCCPSYNTTYYDSQGALCGTSVSEGREFCSNYYSAYTTVYYNSTRHSLGSSITQVHRYSSGCYPSYNTTYYDLKGESCGTSISDGHQYGSDCYPSYTTTYYDSKIYSCGTSVSRSFSDDSSYNTTYCIPQRIAKNAARKRIDILDVEKCYLSVAGSLNVSRLIFYKKNRNEVFRKLDDLAINVPGGAADKTLLQLGLKF